MDNNLNEFEGKVCKVWLKDKFFRQGIIIQVNKFGIILNDRVDGKTFINFDNIKEMVEVKDGSRKS